MYTLDIRRSGMRRTKVDGQGRIVIPKTYRDALNLNQNPWVNISLAEGTITVTPIATVCRLCGKTFNHNEDFQLCLDCLSAIRGIKKHL